VDIIGFAFAPHRICITISLPAESMIFLGYPESKISDAIAVLITLNGGNRIRADRINRIF